jgi:signal transduction histidine kinase
MSLRSKLLGLFLALAVVPLVAVGIFGSAQSLRALEALLSRETLAVAGDAADALGQQLARQESDALLLGENTETQRLYAVPGSDRRVALAQADTFIRAAWKQMAGEYRSLELLDARGAVLYQIGNSDAGIPIGATRTVPVERAITDPGSGETRGSLVLQASIHALLPREMLERRVGNRGYTIVIDRAADRVMYHPHMAWTGQAATRLADTEGWPEGVAAVMPPSGNFTYGRGDSARIASFVSLSSPAWTIISSASLAEFAPPFQRARSVQLLVVLAVTGAITVMFVHLLRRATRSLEELTRAADAVGAGNLAPALPLAGPDEVGRLSTAFDVMTGRLREMIAQVETSRQLAIIGEFASQIAHEIRNPLTSIKLNLQGLARDARSGDFPATSSTSIDISLREIDRLDQVVGGVLALAQSEPVDTALCSLNSLVDQSLRLIREQSAVQRVSILSELEANPDIVRADASRLQGAVLNLVLNALAAMPAGGTLTVRTDVTLSDGRPSVRLHVIDTGAGIEPDARERIFRPFYTSRPTGTGLGLPIARRTVEAHGGRLVLAESLQDGTGARFILELPIATELVAVSSVAR